MTSKNLFFKRLKQDLEQRIWLPVVSFIAGFLLMEVPLFSQMENWKERVNFGDIMQEYLLNSFFSPMEIAVFLTVGVAVVSAMSGFIYIHSTKKLDVYHSIPIRREALFLQQYAYGIIYYFVPMVLHVLICIGICAVHGVLNGMVAVQALWFLAVQLLLYLAHYSVVVVAVCLTGNLVISILGSGVLLTYSLILGVVKSALMENFFMTYYSVYDQMGVPAFSPVHLLVNLVFARDNSDANHWVYTEYLGYYGQLILMAVAYTALALFLYKKRPTEAANNSIAFGASEPVIKTMVVVPVSFVAGFFFQSISYNYEFGWFVFGCIFGFVLCCPLMEIIFRKDVKAVLKHPLQMGVNGVLVIGLLVIFKLDVFGYDTYLPAENKVESCAIFFNDHSTISPAYGNAFNYCMDNMAIEKNESTRKLLMHGAKVTRAACTGVYDDNEDACYRSMLVKYNMENGKEVYRNYLINEGDEQVMQWLADTYNDARYKVGIYPVLAENRELSYGGVMLQGTYASDELPLTDEKMQKLLETYRRELTNLSFEEIQSEYPVAKLAFAVKEAESGEDAKIMERGYRIYPSFTGTLALLEEYGADLGNELSAENVISIHVEDYSREVNDADGYYDKLYVADYTAESGKLEEIAQILSAIQSDNLSRGFYAGEDTPPYIDVRINYYYDGKQYEYGYFSFKEDMIPRFVLQDLVPLGE